MILYSIGLLLLGWLCYLKMNLEVLVFLVPLGEFKTIREIIQRKRAFSQPNFFPDGFSEIMRYIRVIAKSVGFILFGIGFLIENKGLKTYSFLPIVVVYGFSFLASILSDELVLNLF